MDETVKNIEKANMIKKKKMIRNFKANRMLVSIKVVGSTGPIRFVVKKDATVTNVIDNTLRCYARQGRLPIFSSHCTSSFLLYSTYSPAQPLNPRARIGSTGSMEFTMCSNPEAENIDVCANTLRKTCAKWRMWLNNSLGSKLQLFKLTSRVSGRSIRGFCVPV